MSLPSALLRQRGWCRPSSLPLLPPPRCRGGHLPCYGGSGAEGLVPRRCTGGGGGGGGAEAIICFVAAAAAAAAQQQRERSHSAAAMAARSASSYLLAAAAAAQASLLLPLEASDFSSLLLLPAPPPRGSCRPASSFLSLLRRRHGEGPPSPLRRCCRRPWPQGEARGAGGRAGGEPALVKRANTAACVQQGTRASIARVIARVKHCRRLCAVRHGLRHMFETRAQDVPAGAG